MRGLWLALAWVLGTAGCGDLRPVASTGVAKTHVDGFADPTRAEFHGVYLKSKKYDYTPCRSCHGPELAGGSVGVPCSLCHNGGPTACTTCHGFPPTTGAHSAHLPRFPCGTCHVVPSSYEAPGHRDPRPGDKARITFSGLAVQAPAGVNARFEAGRCSGTYCHGAGSPVWTGGAPQAACGTCHTTPPAGHYPGTCNVCHAEVIDAAGRIINQAKHVNGSIQHVDLTQGCTPCHGFPPTTGAHVAHITGGRVGRPVACNECHKVPTDVRSSGHLDDTSPGPEIVFGTLARSAADGREAPSYDRAAQRCSNVYCHGAALPGGVSPSPQWAAGSTATACGNCHGVPMPNHYGDRCSDCHSAVVDRSQRIIRPDLHINGRIDFGLGSAP